jgi:hypothetical protein
MAIETSMKLLRSPAVKSRLLALLGQIQDGNLRREIEEDLKKLSEPTP